MTTLCSRPYRKPRRRVFLVSVPDLGEFMAPHICHCWADSVQDAIEKTETVYKLMPGVLGPEDVTRSCE